MCRSRRNQTESPLLRLPGELRNKIYEYALSQSIFQIVWYNHYGDHLVRTFYPLDLAYLPKTCRQIYQETLLLPTSLNPIEGWTNELFHFFADKFMQCAPFQAIEEVCITYRNSNKDYGPLETGYNERERLTELLLRLRTLCNLARVRIMLHMNMEEYEASSVLRSQLLAKAQILLGRRSRGKQIHVAVFRSGCYMKYLFQ